MQIKFSWTDLIFRPTGVYFLKSHCKKQARHLTCPPTLFSLQGWSFQRGLDKGEDKVEPDWKVTVAASSVIHPRIPSRECQTARWKWAADLTTLDLRCVSPISVFQKHAHTSYTHTLHLSMRLPPASLAIRNVQLIKAMQLVANWEAFCGEDKLPSLWCVFAFSLSTSGFPPLAHILEVIFHYRATAWRKCGAKWFWCKSLRNSVKDFLWIQKKKEIILMCNCLFFSKFFHFAETVFWRVVSPDTERKDLMGSFTHSFKSSFPFIMPLF